MMHKEQKKLTKKHTFLPFLWDMDSFLVRLECKHEEISHIQINLVTDQPQGSPFVCAGTKRGKKLRHANVTTKGWNTKLGVLKDRGFRSEFQPKSHRFSKKGMVKPIFSTLNNPTLSRFFILIRQVQVFMDLRGQTPLSFHSVLAPPIPSGLLHSEAPLKPPNKNTTTSGRLQDVSGCCITKETYCSNTNAIGGKKKMHISIWVFPKIGVPPNHPFNRVFHYKPSILGYYYSWKHPYMLLHMHMM